MEQFTHRDGAAHSVEWERWRAANREAIEDYNARVAANGAFGDQFRRF